MNKTMMTTAAMTAISLVSAVPAHACNAGLPSGDFLSGIVMAIFIAPIAVGVGALVLVGTLKALLFRSF